MADSNPSGPPSSDSLPWAKKRKMKARAAMLNAARLEKQHDTTSTPLTDTSAGTTSSRTEPEEEDHPENSDSSDSDMEIDEDFTEERAQEIFDDFVVALPRDVRRMLAVILMESFKKRQKMQVVAAATEAGSILGYNERTVRKYREEFFSNKGELEETKRGKYARSVVYHDEEINHKAAAWVRENAFQKGAPNMTAYTFCEWVNNDLLPASHLPPQYPRHISVSTAIRWLKHLGFKPQSHKKGVYIDGHEREDVVKHRESFLKSISDLRKTHKPPPLCSDDAPRVRQEADEDKKVLVLVYHDESIYNTNEGQTWMWAEEDHPAILPKTKGSGIMVSDFIEEQTGYLSLSSQEHKDAIKQVRGIPAAARVKFEYGGEREGYWTGERFMAQVKDACDIAKFKYPSTTHTVAFIFDQSSCHKKYAENALLAKNILVKDGGERRVRDTIWAGRPQPMVNADGTAKGLRTILQERGINTSSLKANDMRTILSYHDDFLNEKTQVEHYVEDRGFLCFFLPKFHCELNPIERVWGQSKRYCRAYTNFTLPKLRTIIDPALESVSLDLIRKYYRKVRDYETAYKEGNKAGREVENAVKKYKSHRRVFEKNI